MLGQKLPGRLPGGPCAQLRSYAMAWQQVAPAAGPWTRGGAVCRTSTVAARPVRPLQRSDRWRA